MNYVGIDWAYGRAAWCARSESGAIAGEGLIPADEDGLSRLALKLGTEVRGCVEMMSGAVWVKDQLERAGWSVESPTRARSETSPRLPARSARSTPGCWPSSVAETWSRRSGSLPRRTARSASGFAGEPTWSSCAPRRATGSSGCSRSSVCESRLPACDSPVPWSCSSIAACRRSGAIRSPSIWARSKSSTEGSPRSTMSSPRSLAQTRGPAAADDPRRRTFDQPHLRLGDRRRLPLLIGVKARRLRRARSADQSVG